MVKKEGLLEKVDLRGPGVKDRAGGPATTIGGSSREGTVPPALGVHAVKANKTATAMMERVVAPDPSVSLAMLAPSSMWKMR